MSESEDDIDWDEEEVADEALWKECQEAADSLDTLEFSLEAEPGAADRAASAGAEGDASGGKHRMVSARKSDVIAGLKLHCAHVTALMARALLCWRWAMDGDVQGALLSILPPELVDAFGEKGAPLSAVNRMQGWFHLYFKVLEDSATTAEEGRVGSDPEGLLRVVRRRVGTAFQLAQLFAAGCTAVGLRTRLVQALDCVPARSAALVAASQRTLREQAIETLQNAVDEQERGASAASSEGARAGENPIDYGIPIHRRRRKKPREKGKASSRPVLVSLGAAEEDDARRPGIGPPRCWVEVFCQCDVTLATSAAAESASAVSASTAMRFSDAVEGSGTRSGGKRKRASLRAGRKRPRDGEALPVVDQDRLLAAERRVLAAAASDGSVEPSGAWRWVHCDVAMDAMDCPGSVEVRRKGNAPPSAAVVLRRSGEGAGAQRKFLQDSWRFHFVLAVDDAARCTDVTPRYAEKWSHTQPLRIAQHWWDEALRRVNKQLRRGALLPGVGGRERPAPRGAGGARAEVVVLDDDARASADAVIDLTGPDVARPAAAARAPPAAGGQLLGVSYPVARIEAEAYEESEFVERMASEKMPTSVAGFKKHPRYMLREHLAKFECFMPGTEPVGLFKGKPVFTRSRVKPCKTAKQWLRELREVKAQELSKPVKVLKPRGQKTGDAKVAGYSAGAHLEEGEDEDDDMLLQYGTKLYGHWQTEKWRRPVYVPGGPIPCNQYGNVELWDGDERLLPSNTAYVEGDGTVKVAKELGVPYAPAVLGFERKNGRAYPQIGGVIVPDTAAGLVRDAWTARAQQKYEAAVARHQKAVLQRWHRLVVGVLVDARVDEEYGDKAT